MGAPTQGPRAPLLPGEGRLCPPNPAKQPGPGAAAPFCVAPGKSVLWTDEPGNCVPHSTRVAGAATRPAGPGQHLGTLDVTLEVGNEGSHGQDLGLRTALFSTFNPRNPPARRRGPPDSCRTQADLRTETGRGPRAAHAQRHAGAWQGTARGEAGNPSCPVRRGAKPPPWHTCARARHEQPGVGLGRRRARRAAAQPAEANTADSRRPPTAAGF